MSGFEIVGVVLGVYPLVVTAWEAFSNMKSDQGIQKLITKLRVEETLYEEFVEHLLGPNTSEAQRYYLMNGKSEDKINAWREVALQSNLQNRLGFRKTQLILGILNKIESLLELMKSDLPGAGRSFETRSTRFFKNFKQNLPQSPLQKHIDSLKECNNQLERLLGPRGPPSSIGPWTSLPLQFKLPTRDYSHAIDVYNAICDGYRCDCEVAHFANIALPLISDSRSQDKRAVEYNDQRRLQLLFPVEASKIDGNADILAENPGTSADGYELTPIASGELTSPSVLTRMNTAPQSTPQKGDFETNLKTLSRSVSVHECVDDQSSPIPDLCEYVRTLQSGSDFLDSTGILPSKQKRYKLQAPSSHHVVSLISEMTDTESPLCRGERINLALRLSCAILEYYSTGWIEPEWSWDDFCLTKDPKHPQFERSHLYIRHKFYSSRGTFSRPRAGDALPGIWAQIGEPILTRLGFALIELATQKRLSEMRNNSIDSSLPEDLQDYFTAVHLLQTGIIAREEGSSYEEVVRICLKHEFFCNTDLKMKLIDSRDNSFYAHVESLVVTPLHCIWTEHLGHGRGRTYVR